MEEKKEKKIPYQLRIDKDTLDEIKTSARKNERTVAHEMRYRLKKSKK